jgi:superfamily II DNA or RNA helicase
LKEFPKDIKFKYDWRRYQKRVLSELEGHLDDNHLHIIAPPGSGKTVLGLEVAIRLNKPTLIFAPTVAIRNQWIQRFCELFLQTNERPDWISRDIRNPEFLTVVTYQALHAASTNTMIDEDSEISDTEEESENGENGKTVKTIDTKEIVKSLKEKGI